MADNELDSNLLPTPEPADLSIDAGRQRNQQRRGAIQSAADAASEGSWFDLGDIAAAPFRGAVDAVHGAYGLVDALTGDALPDWESPLGHSHTFIGSALEGIAQFSVGMLPFTGGLGLAGVLPELAEGAGLLANVGRTAAGAAGAAFTAFEGHDKRLSDLIESVPALRNPVTAFLKSDDSDPELWGRFKNSLEQAGLAAAVEPLFFALKKFKAKMGAAGTEGATTESITQAGAEHDDGIRQGLKNLDEGTPAQPTAVPQEPGSMGAPAAKDGQAIADAPGNDPGQPPPATLEQAQEVQAAATETPKAPETPEGARAPEQAPAVQPPPVPESKDPWAVSARALQKLGRTPEQIKELTDLMASKEGAAPHLFTPEGAEFGPNPRTLDRTDRALAGILESDLPMTAFKNETGVPVLLSSVSEAVLPAVLKDLKGIAPQTLKEMDDAGLKSLAEYVGTDAVRLKDQITRGIFGPDGDLNVLAERLARVRTYKTLLDVTGRDNVEHLGFVKQLWDKAPGVTGNLDLELVRADYNMRFFASLQLGVKGMYSMVGRTLRGAQDLTEGMSMGDFLSRASESGGMVNRLPEFDAALASNPKALAAQVNALGGREFMLGQMEKMKMVYDEAGTAGLAKLARMSTAARVTAMTKEFWISALLGSPKTLLVNVLSQTGNSVYGPFEKMMGSQVYKTATKARNALGTGGEVLTRARAIDIAAQDPVMRAAQSQITEMTHSVPDLLKFSKMAWDGENVSIRGNANAVLDPGSRAAAITSTNLGMDSNSVGGKVVDFMANLLRLPTKILGESDKVISQVNARTYAKSWLREEAINAGHLTPETQGKYIADAMEQITDGSQFKTLSSVTTQAFAEAKAGGLTDPKAISDYAAKRIPELFPQDRQALVERSISYARDRNFTTPAEPNSVSWFLQRMSAQHPMMTAIMPFINTPINLLKWTGQRLDAYGLASYMAGRSLGFAEREVISASGAIETTKNRFLREMLSGDPEMKANAVGRLCTGAGLATTALVAAGNGVITGRGPQDPKEREAWLAAGNLPYSIKTSAGQVQFSRLDPAATIFGAAADVMDTIRHMDTEDQPFATSLVHGLGIAFANNITQKSYLTGIQKITEVLTDPDKNMGKYLQSTAASFVPNTLNAATGPVGDDYVRDINGMVDAVQARLPGLSQSLPPRRNILGEPIQRTTAIGSNVNRWADFLLPVAFKQTSDDGITQELARLAYPFAGLSRTVNGQDLTQVPHGDSNAFDRWGELVGTVRVKGDDLRGRLRRLIGSREYQRLEPDIIDGKLSPRADLINRTLHDYRAAAFEKVLQENPKLRSYNQTFTRNRQALRHGLAPTILPTVTE